MSQQMLFRVGITYLYKIGRNQYPYWSMPNLNNKYEVIYVHLIEHFNIGI